MNEVLAVDTSAVVDLLRDADLVPPPLRHARRVFLPLPTLGELYAGAFLSRRVQVQLDALEGATRTWIVISPDPETARIFGRLRGDLGLRDITPSKRTDLWIGAICIQHDLTLLTSDDGFNVFPGLKTLHW